MLNQSASLNPKESSGNYGKNINIFEQYSIMQNQISNASLLQSIEQEDLASLQIKFKQQIKRNKELEDLLHLETINNEEQRVYIELLKRALEQHIDELSIQSFITEAAKEAKMSKIDFFTHINRMKQFVDSQINEQQMQEKLQNEQEIQIGNLQNEIKEQKNQNIQLEQQNQLMENDLRQALNALEQSKQEIKSLETVKLEIKQISEKHKNQYEQQQHEIQRQKKMAEESLKQKQNIEADYNIINANYIELESKYQTIQNEYLQLQKDHEQSIPLSKQNDLNLSENLNIKQQLKKFEMELSEKNNKIRKLESLYDTLENEKSAVDLEKKIIKEEFEALKIKINNSEFGLNGAQIKKNKELENKQKMAEFEQKEKDLTLENNQLKQKLQQLTEQYQQNNQKLEIIKNEEIQKVNQIISLEKVEKQKCQEEVRNLSQVVQELKTQINDQKSNRENQINEVLTQLSQIRADNRQLQEEKQQLLIQNQGFSEQINSLQEFINKNQIILQQNIQESNDLRNINNNIIQENNCIKMQLTQIEEENDKQHQFIKDYENKFLINEQTIESLKLDNNTLEQQLNDIAQQNSTLQENFEKTAKELEDSIRNFQKFEQQVQSANQPLISIITQIREDIGQNNRRVYDCSFIELVQEAKEIFEQLLRDKQKLKLELQQQNQETQRNCQQVKADLEEQQKEYQQLSENFKRLKIEESKLTKEKEEIIKKLHYFQQTKCKEQDLEIVKLSSEVKRLDSENLLLKRQLDLNKEEQERIINLGEKRLSDTNFINQQEKSEICSKLECANNEKKYCEILLDKIKKFIFNKDIIQVGEEICQVILQIKCLENDIQNIEIELNNEQINQTKNTYNQNSQKRNAFKQEGIDKTEELRDYLLEGEKKLKILLQRKISLEDEMSKLEAIEKSKFTNYYNLEKLTNHMKSEIEMLKNEIEMKEISKINVENAYQDLLLDYKRLTKDQQTSSAKRYNYYNQLSPQQLVSDRMNMQDMQAGISRYGYKINSKNASPIVDNLKFIASNTNSKSISPLKKN